MAVNYNELKNNGFLKQAQKDCFSLRLKVIGGNLTAEQLFSIAELSKEYGDGYVHFTSRQAVEIPFIQLENVDAAHAKLKTHGLENGVSGPRVRTISACQGSAVCGSGCIDTYKLAVEVSDRYFGKFLPHKFKIGITGCANNCLKAEENDIGIKGASLVEWLPDACIFCGACSKVCRTKAITQTETEILIEESKCTHCGRCAKTCPTKTWNRKPAYLLSVAGTFGNRIAPGESFLPILDNNKDLFLVIDRILAFFEREGKTKERLRTVVERIGWDNFREEILEVFA
ncbi:hypothetical protein FACS189418_7180 [Clostridia bacterium]|nr:hypothetical protein FACS189418_7180 [Clostridia bacterium]